MAKEEILLVYDKQCPLCDNYCRMVRLRESVGELRLIDAREGGRSHRSKVWGGDLEEHRL